MTRDSGETRRRNEDSLLLFFFFSKILSKLQARGEGGELLCCNFSSSYILEHATFAPFFSLSSYKGIFCREILVTQREERIHPCFCVCHSTPSALLGGKTQEKRLDPPTRPLQMSPILLPASSLHPPSP